MKNSPSVPSALRQDCAVCGLPATETSPTGRPLCNKCLAESLAWAGAVGAAITPRAVCWICDGEKGIETSITGRPICVDCRESMSEDRRRRFFEASAEILYAPFAITRADREYDAATESHRGQGLDRINPHDDPI